MNDDDKEINNLILDWCSVIGKDHHKDRDCHFSIVKHFSYGTEVCYQINHYGYIINPDEEPELNKSYKTHKQARIELIKFLKRNISKEKQRRNENGELL